MMLTIFELILSGLALLMAVLLLFLSPPMIPIVIVLCVIGFVIYRYRHDLPWINSLSSHETSSRHINRQHHGQQRTLGQTTNSMAKKRQEVRRNVTFQSTFDRTGGELSMISALNSPSQSQFSSGIASYLNASSFHSDHHFMPTSSTPFSSPQTSFYQPQLTGNQSPFVFNASYNDLRSRYKTVSTPMSQLGNLPRVRLSNSSYSQPREKKAVTVKIALLPQNVISPQMTLDRLNPLGMSGNTSMSNQTQSSSFGLHGHSIADRSQSRQEEMSNETRRVIEALKEKRKRPTKEEELEESFNSKRNSKRSKPETYNNVSQEKLNGMMPPIKSTYKRSATDTGVVTNKRYKNNEIASSYSSLRPIKLSIKSSKRKPPDSPVDEETSVSKIKRNLSPDNNVVRKIGGDEDARMRMKIQTPEQYDSGERNSIEMVETPISPLMSKPIQIETSQSDKPEMTYNIPLHLHTMEEHERDRKKEGIKLKKYLNALKQVNNSQSQVQGKSSLNAIETPRSQITAVPALQQAQQLSQYEASNTHSASSTSTFTTSSGAATQVTTSLLNSPLPSSVESKESSLQNTSMSSIPSTPPIETPAVSTSLFPIADSTHKKSNPTTTKTATALSTGLDFNFGTPTSLPAYNSLSNNFNSNSASIGSSSTRTTPTSSTSFSLITSSFSTTTSNQFNATTPSISAPISSSSTQSSQSFNPSAFEFNLGSTKQDSAPSFSFGATTSKPLDSLTSSSLSSINTNTNAPAPLPSMPFNFNFLSNSPTLSMPAFGANANPLFNPGSTVSSTRPRSSASRMRNTRTRR